MDAPRETTEHRPERLPTHRLAAAELAGDTSFLLARASALAVGRGNAALADYDLRVRSFSVLSLACSDLDPTQREVAEFLRLDPSQIVALVDELEGRGLVERAPGVSDRRQKVLRATPPGRELHALAAASMDRLQAALFGRLPEPGAETFTGMLRALVFDAPE